MTTVYRKSLKNVGSEERHTFRGTFVRTGSKGGHTRITVLLEDVRRKGSNKILTDHIWFNYTEGFKKLGLECGDEVEFDARVQEYKKGYWGDDEKKAKKRPPASISYKLSHPTKIRKTGNKKPVRQMKSNWEKKRANR